jgi:hypothetical protein
MSEAPDPLEAELAALRLPELSPGLRQRVGERLAHVPTAKQRWLWRLALAGGLAAACLAAVFLWWGSGRQVESDPIAVQPQPAPPALVEDSGPTLLAYERALARSPEELDALLNQHARSAPEPNLERASIGAFTRLDAALHALPGDD